MIGTSYSSISKRQFLPSGERCVESLKLTHTISGHGEQFIEQMLCGDTNDVQGLVILGKVFDSIF